METVHCKSTVSAELACFVELLPQATEDLGVISVITTDGNVQIRNYMQQQTQWPTQHALDVWHVCKNLTKNLSKQATEKVGLFFP